MKGVATNAAGQKSLAMLNGMVQQQAAVLSFEYSPEVDPEAYSQIPGSGPLGPVTVPVIVVVADDTVLVVNVGVIPATAWFVVTVTGVAVPSVAASFHHSGTMPGPLNST